MKKDLSPRDRVFEFIGRTVSKYYYLVIIAALALTVTALLLSEHLKIEMSWLSMAPQETESVKQFEKIIDQFGDANPIIIAIGGDNPDILKKVTDEIALDFKNLKEDIKDVNYKLDRNFIKKYGLLLQKAKDLKRMQKILKDFNLTAFLKNLNDDFEKEYIDQSDEPLRKQEKNAVQSMDALNDMLYSYKAYMNKPSSGIDDLKNSINKFSLGDEYFISRDKSLVLLFVQPYVSMTDMMKIIPVVNKCEEILDKYRDKYKDMKFGQTGMSVLSRDEDVTGKKDIKKSLLSAGIAILFLLIISFRMIAAPFLGMIALLLGIIWDMGITYLYIGRLNYFTAMIGVILIGLGIDYAIHIITGYTQYRHNNLSREDSLIQMYQKTGPGILTGALTTAIAFLVFMISDIGMMKELGFVIGIGIICTFITSLIVLPAMIVAKEKIQTFFKLNILRKKVNMEYGFLGHLGEKVIKKPFLVLGTALVITIFFIIKIPKLYFISDIKKIEAEGLTSIKLMDEISEKFDISTDPVHIIAESVKEANEKSELLEKYNSVGFVDSIANYLPSKEKQKRRLPYLNRIKTMLNSQPRLISINKDELIKEIERLEANIIEMGDMAFTSGLDKLVKRCDEMANLKDNEKAGESIFDKLITLVKKTDISILNRMQDLFASGLKENFLGMCNASEITLKKIPKNIKNLYISKNGKNYLINVYSAKNVWEKILTSPFLKDTAKVAPKMTGTPVFMRDVITYSAKGGREATIFAFIAIFILLLIDFRNIKFTLVSLVPLILGSIWVLGFLVVSNIFFTWMTIMIVPLIIGIGIDDGVHIIHRYRLEGKGSMPVVLRTTGKAVMLTSLTTMIGFGSLSFCMMKGFQQFGLVLFVGIGLLFIFSVVLLPVILTLFEKK